MREGKGEKMENNNEYVTEGGEKMEYNNEYVTDGGEKKVSGLAIASLIMGIISFLVGCCVVPGIILGIISIILAIVSRKDTNGKLSVMAIIGIICSVIGILGSIVSLIIYLFGNTVYSSSRGFI